jgi:hypothetical protein
MAAASAMQFSQMIQKPSPTKMRFVDSGSLQNRQGFGGSEKGWRWYRDGKLAKKITRLPISSPRASISATVAGVRRERSSAMAGRLH